MVTERTLALSWTAADKKLSEQGGYNCGAWRDSAKIKEAVLAKTRAAALHEKGVNVMNTIRVCVAGLICWAAGSAWLAAAEDATAVPKPKSTLVKMDDAKFQNWLERWDKNITNDARNRYCDRELGEEIGWLITPFLDGFYYGYLATEDSKWVA